MLEDDEKNGKYTLLAYLFLDCTFPFDFCMAQWSLMYFGFFLYGCMVYVGFCLELKMHVLLYYAYDVNSEICCGLFENAIDFNYAVLKIK